MSFFIYSPFNKIMPFPWKLNRYSYGVEFGINCTALDQSKLSNFAECTIVETIIIIMSGTLKDTSNHVKLKHFVLLPVSEEAKK